MISIFNYGIGNIQAIANIYKRLNTPAQIVSNPEQLGRAEKIILPGVGAFDWAMKRLQDSGMREVLDELVIGKGKPVLGICVGMQMMAKSSEEGSLPGLGWIDAEVKKFNCATFSQRTYLPHMGWNDAEARNNDALFKNLGGTARFYFLHSFYFAPADPATVLAVTEYGQNFASSVRSRNIYGVQFHPEKSHQWGVQLLKNFAEI